MESTISYVPGHQDHFRTECFLHLPVMKIQKRGIESAMRRFLVVSLVVTLFGVCASKPQFGEQRSPYYNPADRSATILRYENINNGDGNYQYAYETSNGIAAEEQGYLKNAGTNNEVQTAQGSYQYYGPDGVLYKVSYIADEGGFRATGDHLPTSPPIPLEIQKSLDIIYANARNQQAAAGQPIQPQYNRPQGFFRPPQNK